MFVSSVTLAGLRIPTPMTALTAFFYADVETNDHPLPVSGYFIYNLLWLYLCSCMHIMYIIMLCSRRC